MTIRERAQTGRRRFWFDPRFGIGLLLIVVSVVGVLTIVASADSSRPVYAAREPLAPGDTIEPGDLVATSVRLDGAERLYLVPGDVPQSGLVVTRSVARGELVPATAVGSTAGVKQASVVLTVDGELAASVAPGSVVDVWAATETTTGVFDPPVVIVSSATVVRLVERDGIVVDSDTTAVEVLVPRTRIARVLEAVANDDAVSIVAVSMPGR
jgi:flagella basal body P-ring formation protein FlgA